MASLSKVMGMERRGGVGYSQTMAQSNELALLEVQLRLARSRLAAAESGLFATPAALLERYRADVVRLERDIMLLSQ